MKNTLAIASIVGMALVTSASAQFITESGALAGGAILTSQLTDLGPGAQDAGRDYANNTGPAGQTFQVASAGTASFVSVKGRGDAANSWTVGPNPFDGTETWALQLGTVNPVTGAITQSQIEYYTGFTAAINISDYLTFALQTPMALTPGVTYEWTISIDSAAHDGSPWVGWAHSTADAYAGGYAMNNNVSTANPGGGDGGTTPVMGGFAAPNTAGYDYVFAVSAPEPTTIALLGLGGLALVAFRRRA
jgi:PEP-CTERM motif